MITKQMLLSALVIGAMNNIALSIEKPVVFTMNINNKNFLDQLPIPVSEINNTVIVLDTTSEDNPYAYTIYGNLNDLNNHKEEMNKILLKTSNGKTSLNEKVNCVYCPSVALRFNTIILDAKDHNDCNKLAVGFLLANNKELVHEKAKIANEYTQLKNKLTQLIK